MHLTPLPDTTATVVTESSIWHIDHGRYRRSPRDGHARPVPFGAGRDLDDDTWVEFREAWVEPHPAAPGCWRLAFVPAGRGEGAAGVRSGVIVDASFPPVAGTWQT